MHARNFITALLPFCFFSAAFSATPKTNRLADQALRFEENRGQASPRALYVARGPHYRLEIEPTESVLFLDRKHGRAALRTRLRGANRKAVVEAVDRTAVATSYFLGNDPRQWHSDVPSYRKLKIAGVYPKIDLVFYGNGSQLEYDFVVQPGGDARRIQFDISGAESVRIAENGDLVLGAGPDEIRWKKPSIYQSKGATHASVDGAFQVAKDRVSFRLGAYDPSLPLVIDPTLNYSSYFGGSGNEAGVFVATDSSGNVYMVGGTTSQNMPVTAGVAQTSYGGETIDNLSGDGFVAKFNSSGRLVYFTYLGGSADDGVAGIAVDAAGNAYLTGLTNSKNFPVTSGVVQPKFGGQGGNVCNPGGDAFVAKLNPSGTQLLYSTYLGGSADDGGSAIAIDSAGDAYIAGATLSTNFPVTTGVVQSSLKGTGGEPDRPSCNGLPLVDTGDAFVAKLNPTGSALIFATYLGGSLDDAALAIAIDSSQNVYVVGATISTDFPTTPGAFQTVFGGLDNYNNYYFNYGDAFLTVLNSTASAFKFSTYLGGEGDDSADCVVLDSSGNIYVGGSTESANFPTTSTAVQRIFGGPAQIPPNQEQDMGDAFVARFSPAGALTYSTYLGGEANDEGASLAVDSTGMIYVSGTTDSYRFPVTSNAYQTTFAGDGGQFIYTPVGDGFFAIINPNSTSLVYSTYLGGSMDDAFTGLARDPSGNIWITGNTISGGLSSGNFPTTSNAYQKTYGGYNDNHGPPHGDAVLVEFTGFGSGTGAGAPTVTAIQNAASYTSNVVSPGMIFVLYGTGLGPSSLTSGYNGNNFATNIGGVQILFNNVPAPLLYASSTFTSGVVPYEVSGLSNVQIVATNGTQSSTALTVPVGSTVPGLFAANSEGSGQLLGFNAINGQLTLNSASNPAPPGGTVVLYGTGEGLTNPAGVDDGLGGTTATHPIANVTATIGGYPATVVYVGGVYGEIQGLFQINLQLSPNVPAGNQQVLVTIGTSTTQASVTVAVQ